MPKRISKTSEPTLYLPGGPGPYVGLRSVFAALENVPEARALMARTIAKRGGQKGARGRMRLLTPERRSEIARTAAMRRWEKRTKEGKR